MISFDDYANENNAEHNLKWPYIPYYLYRIFIIGAWIWENKCITEFNKQAARY